MDEIKYQMKIKELEQTIEKLRCCGNCGMDCNMLSNGHCDNWQPKENI